jgi:oligoendopeptidase F
MTSWRRHWLALFLAAAASVARADPATPHIDFACYFFASPEVEREKRSEVWDAVHRLQGFRGRIASSASALLAALEANDDVQRRLYRHVSYLHLRSSIDARDEASRQDEERLEADVTSATAFLEPEIRALSDEVLDEWLKDASELAPYRFALARVRRYRGHAPDAATSALLASLEPEIAGWQSELHQHLLDQLHLEPIVVDGRSLDPLRDRRSLAGNPDAAIREKAFRARYAGLAGQEELHAFALLKLATALDRRAAAQGFPDAPSAHYFDDFLTTGEVGALLAQVRDASEVHREYERLRAGNAARALGVAEARVWDVDAAMPTDQQPRFTLDQARAAILRAVQPLGQEYGRELQALLDPASGRLDVGPGEHRRATGFSQGFPGTTSVFYAGSFDGTYNDVRVMAHESAHAVHRSLMDGSGVRPTFADGPHFLFESFAILNELLLADDLEAHETDPTRRRFFLDQFLDGKGMIAFVAGPEAELEERIHLEARAGRLRTAVQIGDLAQTVWSPYSIWPDRAPELRYRWMLVPLLFEDPFYDLNYVYGGILGLEYYRRLRADPSFAPAFVSLLRRGFDDTPQNLLAHGIGLDLRDPRLASSSFAVLRGKLDEYRNATR